MKKRKTIVISSAIVLSLLLGGCMSKQAPTEPAKEEKPATEQQEGAVEEKTEEVVKTDEQKLKEYLEEQELAKEELQTEVDYYKQYVKDITLTLSPDKLQSLIDKEWNYSMTVNGIQFPKNGIMEISLTDFELKAEETRVPYSVLPEEESIKGKMKNKLNSSMSVKAPDKTSSSKIEDAEKKQTLIYSFKDLKNEDVIKIKLSEELSTKLEMSTSELEIRVIN